MGDLTLKVATIVAMTHGLRALGGRLGPRWGGLLMGLPCSTAVALFFLGREQGAEFAAKAAESGILGLVGAVAVALVYATGAAEKRHPVLTLAAAIAAYFVPALAVKGVGRVELIDAVVLSLVAIAAATLSARGVGPLPSVGAGRATSKVRSMVLRTVVPVAFLLTITGLAGSLGPRAAGLLGTFPATFLAVTLVTHLEGGAAVASRTAVAFLPGNLSMVAFLATIGLACRTVGLVPGFGLGYLASFAALALVERAGRAMRPAKRVIA